MPILLDQGADFACRDAADRTTFHRCVAHDRVKTAELLISRFPHAPNMTLLSGCMGSALNLAITTTKSQAMIELLLRHGATVRDSDMFSALEHGNVGTIKLLAELGDGVRAKRCLRSLTTAPFSSSHLLDSYFTTKVFLVDQAFE